MADPKDPKILRDAEGFPFPDEVTTDDSDARRVRGVGRGETLIPSDPALDGANPDDTEIGDGSRECPRGKVWSHREQACIDDPNPDNYDNPNFDFMNCEPSEANLEPPVECEVCTKDPLAFVPEWKRLANEEVFFDGRECLYSAVVFDLPYASNTSDSSAQPTTPQGTIQEIEEEIDSNPDSVSSLTGRSTSDSASFLTDESDSDSLRDSGYINTGLQDDVLMDVVDYETGEIVMTAEEVAALREETIRRRGLELIFEFQQKAEVVKAAEFLPKEETGVGQVTSALFPFLPGAKESGKYTREEKDINMIDELLKLKGVVSTERLVSLRPNIPDKFLISVPVEYIIELPSVVVADIPSEIPVDEPLKVQFMGEDIKEKFHIMANSLNGAMMVYHRQYQIWLRQGGGVFKKTRYNSETERFEPTGKNYKLDLRDQAEKMREFLDELSFLLGTQGLIIPGYGFELRTQGPNVEKVVINIENIDKSPGGKLRIKNVKANKKGCETVVFSENRPHTKHYFKKFERKFRNSTLLAYIGQVPNMCITSQARDPSEWFDWVVEHTYPPVEIQLGLNASDPASEASLASCAVGGLIIDPVEEILKSLGEELGQVLQDKLSETICMTPEELELELDMDKRARERAKKSC
jgi:hypothetical protein